MNDQRKNIAILIPIFNRIESTKNGTPGRTRPQASLAPRIQRTPGLEGSLLLKVTGFAEMARREGFASTNAAAPHSCDGSRPKADRNPRPSGSKRDPDREIIEEIPFPSKMPVDPDRFPDPLDLRTS